MSGMYVPVREKGRVECTLPFREIGTSGMYVPVREIRTSGMYVALQGNTDEWNVRAC